MASVLNAKAFLERVWPDTGPYYVAIPAINKDTGKEGYWHYGVDTIDDAVTKATSLCFSENKDVYFVVHAIKEKKVLDPVRGIMRSSRKHENMREARVFFFDLDVGKEEKPQDGKPISPKFATRELALSALEQFIFRTGLPRPLLVSSGGGFHVYWVLSEGVDSVRWRTFADRLRFLARKHGLRVDPARTTDQSSVLRVVGTKNLKPHVNQHVRCLDAGVVTDTAELLSLLEALSPDYEPLARVHRSDLNSGGSNSGLEFSGRKTPVKELHEICAQVRNFEAMKGQLEEPAWYDMLGLLRWADEGEEEAHRISALDPRYDAGETQQKIDQWADKNPPTCRTIDGRADNKLCESCPFFERHTNPLVVANKEWEAKAKPAPKLTLVVDNTKPIEPEYMPVEITPPYGRVNGGVGKYVMDPEVKVMVLKLFCTYDIFPVASYMGESGSDEDAYSYWAVTFPKTGQRLIRLSNAIFHDLREFRVATIRNSIWVPDDRDLSELKKFMLHYLRQLQTQIAEADMFTHVGWVHNEDNTIKTFVLYEQAWDFTQKRFRHCAMARSMHAAKPMFASGGTLEGQIDALQFFNHPDYLRMQYMILASAASPFFFVTGEAGVILSMSGETASSKTTTARGAAGIWGAPDIYMMSGLDAGATFNAKIDRMMLMNNLPFIMDEFTNADPKDVSDTALIATQPAGKITLNRNREMRTHRSGHRSNFIIVTSNDSLHQLCASHNIAGQAAQTRIVEINFPRMLGGKVAADRALRKIQTHYGHVGRRLMELLLPEHEAVCEEIRDMMDQMTTLYKVKPHERFQVNHLAVLLVVGRRAYQAGLLPYDPDAIIAWFVNNQLKDIRNPLTGGQLKIDNDEIVANFLSDIHGETLRIEVDKAGNLGGALIIPNQKINARYDIGDKLITISSMRFKIWCDTRRLNSKRVIMELTNDKKIIEQGKFNLTSGVESAQLLRMHCYRLDVTKFAGVVHNVVK